MRQSDRNKGSFFSYHTMRLFKALHFQKRFILTLMNGYIFWEKLPEADYNDFQSCQLSNMLTDSTARNIRL